MSSWKSFKKMVFHWKFKMIRKRASCTNFFHAGMILQFKLFLAIYTNFLAMRETRWLRIAVVTFTNVLNALQFELVEVLARVFAAIFRATFARFNFACSCWYLCVWNIQVRRENPRESHGDSTHFSTHFKLVNVCDKLLNLFSISPLDVLVWCVLIKNGQINGKRGGFYTSPRRFFLVRLTETSLDKNPSIRLGLEQNCSECTVSYNVLVCASDGSYEFQNTIEVRDKKISYLRHRVGVGNRMDIFKILRA